MSTSAMPLTQSTRKGRRELKNAVATALIVASFVIALIPLTFIIVYVTRAGATVFNLNFLTDDLPFSNRFEGGGIYPAIVGTLVITGTATAMAVPLGILGLFVGWGRWLELRLPEASRRAGWLWTLCFTAVGAVLLVYREA